MYYSILKTIGKEIYDKPDHWPVEEYDDGGHKIIFETVEALIDDVLEFAGILQKYLLQIIESTEPRVEFAHLFKKENLQFVIEGTAEYTFSGENCRFRIELNNERLTIQESENYIFFGSMYFSNYDEFCATKTILCDDLSKLCRKEEFDADCEYCVTYDKLYVDEYPPYGKKTFADKYMKTGVVYTFDDTDAAFNGVPTKEKVTLTDELEIKIIKWFMSGVSLPPLEKIREHFSDYSQEEVQKALDGLVRRDIIFGGENIFGSPYGLCNEDVEIYDASGKEITRTPLGSVDGNNSAMLTFAFEEGLTFKGLGYSIAIPDGFRFQQNMEVTDSIGTSIRDFVAWSPNGLNPEQWDKADVAILSAVKDSRADIFKNPVEYFENVKESLVGLGKQGNFNLLRVLRVACYVALKVRNSASYCPKS